MQWRLVEVGKSVNDFYFFIYVSHSIKTSIIKSITIVLTFDSILNLCHLYEGFSSTLKSIIDVRSNPHCPHQFWKAGGSHPCLYAMFSISVYLSYSAKLM